MTASQQLEVDAYILVASNLIPTSRGYKGLQILLNHGNLLYCYLGKWNTLHLTKLLFHLKFRYKYVTGGRKLYENSKSEFYHNVLHYRAPNIKPHSTGNVVNRVGKEEREENRIGWADRKFKQ